MSVFYSCRCMLQNMERSGSECNVITRILLIQVTKPGVFNIFFYNCCETLVKVMNNLPKLCRSRILTCEMLITCVTRS